MLLHLTIQTNHDPRLAGTVPCIETYKGDLALLLAHVETAVLRAQHAGVLETDGSVTFAIQKAKVQVAGVPGRDR